MYMKICFYGGASKEIKSEYTEEAYKLGEELVKRGFQPLGTLPNPKEEYRQFDSWVFVWSEELQKNLDELKGR